MKKYLLILTFCVLFTACSKQTNPSYEMIEQTNCTAINLISVFAVRPEVTEIIDLRKQDQKTHENTFFTPKEYCELSALDLSSVINIYEQKVNYANKINFNNGVLTIGSSGKNYVVLENSFNFMAIDKKYDILYFKNAQKVKLGKKYLQLNVLSDYSHEDRPFVLELNIFSSKDKDNPIEQTILTLDEKKNMFVFDEYIITF